MITMRALSPDARYRWQIAARALTAIFGGFALANASGILLAYLLPLPKNEAVTVGMLLSFAIYAGAAMWVFAHRSLIKSAGGIWLLAAIFFALIALFKFAGVTL